MKNTLTETESSLRRAIMAMAVSEHHYLKASQKHDGFELDEVDSSDVTDEEFTAFFDMRMDGRVINFAYSLGFDVESGTYSPYAEICGGSEEIPGQHQFRVRSYASAGKVGQGQEEVLNSIEELSRECGEIRFSAFRWLELNTERDFLAQQEKS